MQQPKDAYQVYASIVAGQHKSRPFLITDDREARKFVFAITDIISNKFIDQYEKDPEKLPSVVRSYFDALISENDERYMQRLLHEIAKAAYTKLVPLLIGTALRAYPLSTVYTETGAAGFTGVEYHVRAYTQGDLN